MSEETAFLAAIAAQLDDDVPRLAFADWLDERDRSNTTDRRTVATSIHDSGSGQ